MRTPPRLRYKHLAFGVGLALGSLLVCGVAAAASGIAANAAPTGGEIVGGVGSIARQGASTIVNQQSKLLSLNWQTFNVGKDASVLFQQPGASAIALNRILDQNPSQIFGKIDSNGQVFLINTHGIIFGASAKLNVGGLVASTLDLTPQDFLARHFTLDAHGGSAGIVNHGTIAAASGGSVSLIGGQVQNDGLIVADYGHINLDGADQAVLNFDGDGLINVQITGALKQRFDADQAAVVNAGTLRADSGTVVLQASAAKNLFTDLVNNSGVIDAHGISKSGGVVRLVGSGGNVIDSGSINVSGTTGGSAQLLSDQNVGVMGGSINASGTQGGGSIRVGGGWQGGEGLQTAAATYVAPDATLDADATQSGNGGSVVVWGNEVNNFYGSISARGGIFGGNGGQVETSSHYGLNAQGSVDASAPNGQAGSWLMDPYDVEIVSTGTGSLSGGIFSSSSTTSTITPGTIETALEGGTSVAIFTGGGGSNNPTGGDITVTDPIAVTGATGASTLSLQAAGSIFLNAGISGDGTHALNVNLWANYGGAAGDTTYTHNSACVATSGCVVVIGNTAGASSITTDGGNLDIETGPGYGGGALTLGYQNAGNIDTGTGNLIVSAVGISQGLGSVKVGGTSTFDTDTGTGDITLANSGNDFIGLITVNGAGAVELNGSGTLDMGAVSNTFSLTLDSASTLNDNITTSGAQTYKGAVALGANVTLTTTNSNVTFGSTVANAVSGTPEGLKIAAGTGVVKFTGAVGSAGDALGALEVDGTGDTTLGSTVNAASLTTNTGTTTLDGNVTTGGAQAYNGAVALGANVTLTTTNGNVTFGSTVANAVSGTPEGLKIAAGTGLVKFTGAVGSVGDALGALEVDGTGDTTFGSTVDAASLTTNTGTTTLDGNVTTSGTQTYNGTLSLGNAITLKGTTVTLHAITGNGNNLNVTGDAELDGTATVGSLDVSGTAAFEAGGSVTGNLAADTLDYSGYGSAVTFDVANGTGTTTGIGGTWINVGTVIGNGTNAGIIGLGADVFTLSGTQAGSADGIGFSGFTSADTSQIKGAVNFDDGAKTGEGITFVNASSVSGGGTISNVAGDFDDGTGKSSATGITYSGFGAVAGTGGGSVTDVTGDFDDGTGESSATSIVYTGFGAVAGTSGGSVTDVTGDFDDGTGESSSTGIIYTDFGKVEGTSSGSVTDVTGNFDDGTGKSSATSIIYTGFGTVAGTGGGSVTDVTGDFDDGTGKSSATSIIYTGFGAVAGTGGGSVTDVTGDFDDGTGESSATSIIYTGFGAVAGTGGGSVTDVTGNFDDGTGTSSASGTIYTGFGTVAGTGGGTVTGVADSFDDGTGKSSMTGVIYTDFGAVTGMGGVVTGVAGNFDVGTDISSASGIDYSGFHLTTVKGNGATAGITGLGAMTFALSGTQAGTADNINFSGFTAADTSQVANAQGFDDDTKSSEGMTFVNATNVDGSGTISKVDGDFNDNTGESLASGITYTGFDAVTGTGGSVTDVLGDFDVDTDVSVASGIDYSGFHLVTVAAGGTAATLKGAGDTYTLAGADTGGVNGLTWTWVGFGNIDDATGTVDFGTGGSVGGDVTVATLDYGNYTNGAVAVNLSGTGTTGVGGTVSGISNITSLQALAVTGTSAGALGLTTTGAGATTTLGNLSVNGNLSVDSSGAVLQDGTGPLKVSGTTGINAHANAITLDDPNNDLSGAVSLTNTGNNAVYVGNGGNALTLGTLSLGSGALTLTDYGTTPLRLTQSITTDGGAVKFGGAVTLDNSSVVIDTTDGGATTAGANISFGGAVEGATAGADSLDLNAGSGGSVTFGGDVGAVALGNLTVTAKSLAGVPATLSVNGNLSIDTVDALTTGASWSGANVSLASGGNLILGGDVKATAATGTVSLASDGTISQSAGGIHAYTLKGGSTGSTTLNGNNSITNLGDFSANGFALTDNHALTVLANDTVNGNGSTQLKTTGAGNGLTINGRVMGNTITLASASAINEGTNGVVQAATLTGSSTGATSLTGNNAIVSLGNFTAVGFALTNGQALTVANGAAVNGGSSTTLTTTGANSDLTINGTVSGTATRLVSSGGIGEGANGKITATTLTGSSAAAASLGGDNRVTNLGNFSADGLTFNDGTALTIASGAVVNGGSTTRITTTGSGSDLTINGTLAGTTTELASAGAISEGASGKIQAGTLTGSAAHGAQLTGTNAISTLGNFTASGLALTNGQALTIANGATVDGGASTTLTTTGANSNLAIDGTLKGTTTTLLASGAITEGSSGALQAGTLTGSSVGATSLTGHNNVANLGNFTANGFSLTTGSDLTVVAGNTVDGGASTTLATTGAGHDLTVDGVVSGATTTLVSAGAIGEGSAGRIVADTLTGSAVGDATLKGANQIAALGTFNAKDFYLTDAHALAVGGPLTTTGGAGNISLVTTGGNGNTLTVDQAVKGAAITMASAGDLTVANAVTGTKVDLASNGKLAINALVDSGTGTVTLAQAGAGGITGGPNGSIHAGTLTGSATDATVLGSAAQFMDNRVGVLGGFTSPAGFSFTNGQTLTLASVNGSAYTVDAGQSAVYFGVENGDLLQNGSNWLYDGIGTWASTGHIGLASAPIYVMGVSNQAVASIGLPPAYFYAIDQNGNLLPLSGGNSVNVPTSILSSKSQGVNGHGDRYIDVSVITANYRSYGVVQPGILLPPDQLECSPDQATSASPCPENN